MLPMATCRISRQTAISCHFLLPRADLEQAATFRRIGWFTKLVESANGTDISHKSLALTESALSESPARFPAQPPALQISETKAVFGPVWRNESQGCNAVAREIIIGNTVEAIIDSHVRCYIQSGLRQEASARKQKTRLEEFRNRL